MASTSSNPLSVSHCMASTSSTPLTVSTHPPHWKYDVFLSFRGEDTRNSFTSHLYSALIQMGIDAYKDDKDLERGKTIELELWNAIEESKFSIVIFSNDYASSPWCLDELVKIIECMKMRGQNVLPIFYDVDPSDIVDQKGSYEKAFIRYEEEVKDKKEKVRKWRDTLSDAANLSGWDVRYRDQSEIIKEIVDKVWHGVSNKLLISDKGLVGMKVHMEKMRRLLGEDQSMDARFIGICGMGGVGKTTIAEVVHDRMLQHFEVCCFLRNIKEAFKNNGVTFLQEQLLSKITKKKDMKVLDVKSGASEIQKCLRNRKVLIILDDVDNLEQLKLLAGERDWFSPGSRVIITSRDSHLLSSHGVDGIYEVNVLNEEEAIVLFSRKAFKQDWPPTDYLELAKPVLAYSKGLPLALSVLGSFFYDRSSIAWKDAASRLDEAPHKEIIDVLRISFDGLKELEKQIFLDIACCFHGEDMEEVTKITHACGFHAHIGVQVLIDKSLIRISEKKIQMHELLRVMGRSIVKPEPHTELRRCSRLWDWDDIVQVLQNTTEDKDLEVIFLKKELSLKEHLKMEALSRMSKLRILKIKTEFAFPRGGLSYLSNELRYFDWWGYPCKSLPSSFSPDNLIELCLSGEKIKRLWRGHKTLNCLKSLSLYHCNNLVEAPDFTGTPNLERLIISNSKKLPKLHSSFQNLERLVEVNLECCEKLKKIASSIEMKNLQAFDLSHCSRLKEFPTIRGIIPGLHHLDLSGTDLRTLPDSIQNIKGLVSIRLQSCENLQSLPSSIVRLNSLELLDLYDCSSLDKLPEDMCQLTSLKRLHLKRTGIRQIPVSIFSLKNLEKLDYGREAYTRSEFTSLKLDIKRAREVEVLVIPSMSVMVSLERLELVYCNLGEGSIPDDIGCLSKLTYLNLKGNNFVSLPRSIIQLGKLSELILDDCRELQTLPDIPPKVCELSVNGCIALKELPDPMKLQYGGGSIFQCLNCMKLLKINRGNHLASKMIRRYLKGSSVRRSQFGVILPGRKIPRWFTNHAEGNEIMIPTPTDVLSSGSMAFAACVLFKIRYRSPTRATYVAIDCYIDDDRRNIMGNELSWHVGSTYDKVGSDHCWACYVPFHSVSGLVRKPTSHLRLSFWNSSRFDKTLKIKRCGVRLVSFQEIQEFETEDEDSSSCEDYKIDVEDGSEEFDERELSYGFLERMLCSVAHSVRKCKFRSAVCCFILFILVCGRWL